MGNQPTPMAGYARRHDAIAGLRGTDANGRVSPFQRGHGIGAAVLDVAMPVFGIRGMRLSVQLRRR